MGEQVLRHNVSATATTAHASVPRRTRASDSPLLRRKTTPEWDPRVGDGGCEHDRDDAECCPFNRQRNEDKGDRAVRHSGSARPGGAIIKALRRPCTVASGGCTGGPRITVKMVGSVFHPEIQEIKKNKYYRMVIVVNFPGGLGSFRR